MISYDYDYDYDYDYYKYYFANCWSIFYLLLFSINTSLLATRNKRKSTHHFPGWRTFGGSQVNFMAVVFNLIAITFQGASTLNKKRKM